MGHSVYLINLNRKKSPPSPLYSTCFEEVLGVVVSTAIDVASPRTSYLQIDQIESKDDNFLPLNQTYIAYSVVVVQEE